MSDPDEIPDFRRLDRRITSSGQPSEGDLATLAGLGVRHVINLGLHTHAKALPDEAASLTALGIRYIHIPVDFERPAERDFAAFRAAMAALPDEPVHVHCIANMRVSVFLYRWQREVLGRGEAEARALMDTVWQPGGAWAAFIGDDDAIPLPHRGPRTLAG